VINLTGFGPVLKGTMKLKKMVKVVLYWVKLQTVGIHEWL
jgi:hypothetical protein